jgi:Tol biopolymer transport system component
MHNFYARRAALVAKKDRYAQRRACLALVACAFFIVTAARAQSDEGRWFRNIRQITDARMGLDKAGEAYFSADGNRICFQAVPEGKKEYQIYVMNLSGGGPEMVSTGQGATTCAYFHPDGKRLLFGSNHLDPRPVATPEEVKAAAEKAGVRNYQWSFYPGMDIFVFTFADKKLERLIDWPGYDAEASWSGDGGKLVFTSMRDGDQEIYVADADGKNARRITNSRGYDGGPFFSADGKRLFYRSDRFNNGNLQIFVNNLEGTDERALTADKDILHWCPFWHPSGKWLIFTRAMHGEKERPNYDLYLLPVPDAQVDAAANEAKAIRVTTDPAFDGLPVFSNDGQKLMWTSKRGGLSGAQVFIADFAGVP